MANVKTTIKLRRDTLINYASFSTHIPLKGEVCIVDPVVDTPWAQTKNIRFKIGDGVTTWANLKYVDEENPSIIRGYYYEGKFYKDLEHTQEITYFDGMNLYVDLHEGIIYYYNGVTLRANTVKLPTASATDPGVMKLYNTHGQSIDGTMTQKAITDAIDAIQLVATEDGKEDEYCLSLAKPW